MEVAVPMSQNDILHLEAHFKDWSIKRTPGLTGIQPFLYYSLEQILKPFNLEDDDIRYGITERGNDGGIDAAYFIANRNTLVRDDLDIATSGTSKVRLVIIQVKSSLTETGFNALDVEKFKLFTEDLLNLSRPASAFAHKYQPRLLTLVSFRQACTTPHPDQKIQNIFDLAGRPSGQPAGARHCLPVIPWHPIGWIGRQLSGVALQLCQVVERSGAVQLAGVDQTHEQVAHLRPV